MQFEIVKTNIINVGTDAIVLPANPQLKEGSGASTAIFQAAGRKQLTQACKKIGHCPVGSAVPTLAYDLSAKYIIHAVVSKWIDGNHNEYDLLSSAYLSSLQVADVMGCQSIAFPLLASGNNGYDLGLAFQIAKESIESFNGTALSKVIIVLYGERVTALVRSLGYTVIEIPDGLRKEELALEHKQKMMKMVQEGKEVALDFIEKQIQRGLDYIKDEKNQQKLIAAGVAIAKLAFKAKNPLK